MLVSVSLPATRFRVMEREKKKESEWSGTFLVSLWSWLSFLLSKQSFAIVEMNF